MRRVENRQPTCVQKSLNSINVFQSLVYHQIKILCTCKENIRTQIDRQATLIYSIPKIKTICSSHSFTIFFLGMCDCLQLLNPFPLIIENILLKIGILPAAPYPKIARKCLTTAINSKSPFALSFSSQSEKNINHTQKSFQSELD